MLFPVEYEIKVYDEIEGKEETLHGVTFSDSFHGAMENIEEYFGDELIEVTLFMNEDVPVPLYVFEDTMKSYSHGMLKITGVEKWEKSN